jgi:DNA-binding CsgD family transcriptional regulator
VLASIYEAALQPAQWAVALEQIGTQISASSAFLFSSHSETEPEAFVHVHNHAPEMARDFGAYWHTQDEWANAARRTGIMRSGTWVVGTELVPVDHLRKTTFFNDFCKPNGIEGLLGGVLFDGSEADGMPFTNVCWYRPPEAEPFQAGEKERVKALVPHLQRALRVQRGIRALADDRVEKALGALRVASLVLDREGRLHTCNQVAATLLESLPAGCVRFGQLRSIGEKCSPSIAEALAACSAANPVRIVAVLPAGRPQLVEATLMRLPSEGMSPLGSHEDERFLLLIELPRTDGYGAAAAVAGLYGFSPAEVRVLGGLLEGATPAEISAASGTTMNTVRTQIGHLLQKTNTKRQTELLLLMRGMRF